MKKIVSNNGKWLNAVIIALVIVNIGFYFYEKKVRSEPQVFVLQGTAAPTPTQNTGVKKSTSVSIQFFGDMMLDRNVAKKMASSGLDYIFQRSINDNISLFRNTDYRIANLEGPFAPKRIKTGKEIAFRFDPSLAQGLQRYGFSAFNLANNHSYDMGKTNVKFTRDTLVTSSMQWFGDELNEGPAYTWYASSTGKRVAFLGLHNTYHQLDMSKVESALTDARANSDYVVVNVHWGEEYKPLSNKKQQNLGHWLIDHGADAVIGHHPHVTEEAEVYNGKPIFYSLGNFVFDQYFSPETQTSLSVVLTFADDGKRTVEMIPFYSENSQDIPMVGAQRDDFLLKFENDSRLGDKKIVNGVIEF